MPDQKYPQFSRNGLRSSSNEILSARPRSGVVQEKVALTSDRNSTQQPAAGTNSVRSLAVDSNAVRSQSPNNRKRPKVPFTVHIDPLVKSDMERQAELDGISASREGADLLEEMLHQKLHHRKAATLGSVIEAIIDRKFSQRDNRLAYLLVLILLSTEQTRYIQANIFSRMPGVTAKILDDTLDKADSEARRKIAKRNPKRQDIKVMMQELQTMLGATEEEQQEEQTKPPPAK